MSKPNKENDLNNKSHIIAKELFTDNPKLIVNQIAIVETMPGYYKLWCGAVKMSKSPFD
jgi:hypothetical protein